MDTGSVIDVDAMHVVDPTETYQTTEGWGTSICWFGNVIGGWDAANRDVVADLLFDEATGLGLNVLRYNIGGGDAPGHNHMGVGKEMPGVKATEGAEYDYSADQNQINFMLAALERIPAANAILEAFSNSPPWWMTQSGCASGAAGGGNNLKTDYYDDFADFLADVTLHFRDEMGISFRTVEPLNEPMGTWWNENGGQEGCHFDRAQQAQVISELRASLDERGLSEVQIAAPDESSLDETVDTYESFNMEVRGMLSQINTHAYAGSQRSELRDLADADGKRLWSSEIDGSGAPAPFDVPPYGHVHDDIRPGLDLAQRIVRDLRQMHVDAFVFWQAVESEQAQTNLGKNWGLLHGDFEGSSEQATITKKYHVMHQYTSAIRPGDTMIGVDDNEAVAFMNATTNKLVIVRRNADPSEATVGYDLSGFSRLGTQARVIRTSTSEDFEELSPIDLVDGVLVAPLAANSITTWVIDCAAP